MCYYRVFPIVGAAILLRMPGAVAAELPTYEVAGFPITSHQISVVGSAQVKESYRASSLIVEGMPASPHQIAVLTGRPKKAIASK
jgi:hypothetical protein